MIVNHYGLHWADGDIGLLVQQNRVDHILGVKFEIPVTVRSPRQGLSCPHDIKLDQAEPASLPDDPLIQAMLPLPKQFGDKAVVLEDTLSNKTLVNELLRLCGGGAMFPLWAAAPEVTHARLHLTNVSPLVLFGYEPHYQPTISKLLEASFFAPRRLVYLAPSWAVLREEAERISTSLTKKDVEALPLEQSGAHMLRERMKKRA